MGLWPRYPSVLHLEVGTYWKLIYLCPKTKMCFTAEGILSISTHTYICVYFIFSSFTLVSFFLNQMRFILHKTKVKLIEDQHSLFLLFLTRKLKYFLALLSLTQRPKFPFLMWSIMFPNLFSFIKDLIFVSSFLVKLVADGFS